MLRSNIFDYSDACIAIKAIITAEGEKELNNRGLILKNNAPFISCIVTLTDNAEDLEVAIPMYNLIESPEKIIQRYLVLYGIITKIFSVDPVGSESFKCKTSITGKQLIMEIQKKLNFLFQWSILVNFGDH